jgi:hypothetical protein
MGDGVVPEYLQASIPIKVRKPKKRVVKKSVSEQEVDVAHEGADALSDITVPATTQGPVTTSVTPESAKPAATEPDVATEPSGESTTSEDNNKHRPKITVVDATLEELKAATKVMEWKPSSDAFLGSNIHSKNRATHTATTDI